MDELSSMQEENLTIVDNTLYNFSGFLYLIQLMSRLHKTIVKPLGNQDCCSEYIEDVEDGENVHESTLRKDTDTAGDAGPSTRTVYEKHGLWLNGDNAAENRGLLQGDYVVPSVHHTLFTSHTMVEGIEGDTVEIVEGDLYSNREGRPALIISSTSWYELFHLDQPPNLINIMWL